MLDQQYFAYDSKAPLALTALSERIQEFGILRMLALMVEKFQPILSFPHSEHQ